MFKLDENSRNKEKTEENNDKTYPNNLPIKAMNNARPSIGLVAKSQKQAKRKAKRKRKKW